MRSARTRPPGIGPPPASVRRPDSAKPPEVSPTVEEETPAARRGAGALRRCVRPVASDASGPGPRRPGQPSSATAASPSRIAAAAARPQVGFAMVPSSRSPDTSLPARGAGGAPINCGTARRASVSAGDAIGRGAGSPTARGRGWRCARTSRRARRTNRRLGPAAGRCRSGASWRRRRGCVRRPRRWPRPRSRPHGPNLGRPQTVRLSRLRERVRGAMFHGYTHSDSFCRAAAVLVIVSVKRHGNPVQE